jgi:hypothetical protein
MGISHHLFNEWLSGDCGALLVSLDRTPPYSLPLQASCCSVVDDENFLEHECPGSKITFLFIVFS